MGYDISGAAYTEEPGGGRYAELLAAPGQAALNLPQDMVAKVRELLSGRQIELAKELEVLRDRGTPEDQIRRYQQMQQAKLRGEPATQATNAPYGMTPAPADWLRQVSAAANAARPEAKLAALSRRQAAPTGAGEVALPPDVAAALAKLRVAKDAALEKEQEAADGLVIGSRKKELDDYLTKEKKPAALTDTPEFWDSLFARSMEALGGQAHISDVLSGFGKDVGMARKTAREREEKSRDASRNIFLKGLDMGAADTAEANAKLLAKAGVGAKQAMLDADTPMEALRIAAENRKFKQEKDIAHIRTRERQPTMLEQAMQVAKMTPAERTLLEQGAAVLRGRPELRPMADADVQTRDARILARAGELEKQGTEKKAAKLQATREVDSEYMRMGIRAPGAAPQMDLAAAAYGAPR